MFTIFIFVLTAVALVLLAIFTDGLMELYKLEQEEKKNTVREGMEGYLDQIFGFGRVIPFKSIIDADGNVRYLVYLPKYEWFKSPEYKWFEVYATHKGYQHIEIQR